VIDRLVFEDGKAEAGYREVRIAFSSWQNVNILRKYWQ